jgi:hypothetical protein
MRKTRDYLLHFPVGDGEVFCRLRIFEKPGRVPVVVVTELSLGAGPRLAKVEPYLAAEVLARHFPDRFELPEPVHWVEHRERGEWELRRNVPEFYLVEFASYTPRLETRGARTQRRIGRARWTRVARDAVEEMIGQPLGEP